MRLLKTIFKISLSKFLIYKSTAFFLILFTLIFTIAEYFLAYIYFSHTDTLGGYDYNDFILLITTSKIVFIIYQILFINSHEGMIDKIIDGQLDYDLLRPIDSMTFLSFKEIEIGSIISLIFPLVILGMILPTYNLTFMSLFLYILMIYLGVLLYYHFNQFVVNLAFWIEKPFVLFGYVEDIFDLGGNPKNIFPGAIYMVFTYVFPVLMITNLPVEIIKGTFQYKYIIYLFIFYFMIKTLNRYLWKKGVSKYSVSC